MAVMLSLGVQLRRLRLARKLSQSELAKDVGVSQASISNYERDVLAPNDGTLQALAATLHASYDELATARDSAPAPEPTSSTLDETVARFLKTVRDLPNAGLWTRASHRISGDLAFTLARGDQRYFVVVDGQGTGETAAAGSVLLATFILGVIQGAKGICWPTQVLDGTQRVPDILAHAMKGAVLVALFDTVRRSFHHSRTSGMPPPYLHDPGVSTAALQGRESELGRFRQGDVSDIAPRAMLLLATDGVANAARSRGRPLWRSPDIRTWLTKVRSPTDLARRVGERAATGLPSGEVDDMLVLALEL